MTRWMGSPGLDSPFCSRSDQKSRVSLSVSSFTLQNSQKTKRKLRSVYVQNEQIKWTIFVLCSLPFRLRCSESALEDTLAREDWIAFGRSLDAPCGHHESRIAVIRVMTRCQWASRPGGYILHSDMPAKYARLHTWQVKRPCQQWVFRESSLVTATLSYSEETLIYRRVSMRKFVP